LSSGHFRNINDASASICAWPRRSPGRLWLRLIRQPVSRPDSTRIAYLEAHGKPVAFYSDKHGIFRVNSKEAAGGDGVTQFGRALLALNIDIICANSPQAKGRIERAFGTLQDRMVKELRLAGVSSMATANAWLPGFITAYNTRFGRDPAWTRSRA
jgi:hypothetical protein